MNSTTVPEARAVMVLTVDDQPAFRAAAATVIEATPGFEQAGEASSGAAAVELATRLHPDLVLVDVRMPGLDGIETTRRLQVADPDAVVVLISVDDVSEIQRLAEGCGAAAFVRKQDLKPALLAELWARHGSRR